MKDKKSIIMQNLKFVNDLYNYDKILFYFEDNFYLLMKRLREQKKIDRKQ